MFSRDEISRTKHEFWTTFGRYMRPVLSSQGEKINWVNYHTGIKDLYFRMETSGKSASIAISIEHKDHDIQQLYFEQLVEMQDIFHATLEETWDWQQHAEVDGKVVCRISKTLDGASIMNRDDWSDLISFFKPRIIALDAFWEDGKYTLMGIFD
jgi:hypothetical protein